MVPILRVGAAGSARANDALISVRVSLTVLVGRKAGRVVVRVAVVELADARPLRHAERFVVLGGCLSSVSFSKMKLASRCPPLPAGDQVFEVTVRRPIHGLFRAIRGLTAPRVVPRKQIGYLRSST